MKKTISIIILLALLALVSCTAKSVEIDVAEAAQTILDGVTFRDSLFRIEDDAVVYYYGDKVEGLPCAVYVGSGATAEQVAVFEAEDEAAADIVLDAMKSHVESEINSFRDYIPEEVAVLENAITVKSGRYVALVVGGGSDTLKVVESAMK